MDKALRILIGIVSVPLLLGGTKIMFDPAGMAGVLGLTVDGNVGLSTLRGAMAPVLLGSGLLLLFGAIKKNAAWLSAVGVLMAIMTAGRLLGLAVDGISPVGLRAAVVEAVIVVLALAGYMRLR